MRLGVKLRLVASNDPFPVISFLFKKVDRISTATEIIKNIKAVEDMSEDMSKFHNLYISNSFKTLRNRV